MAGVKRPYAVMAGAFDEIPSQTITPPEHNQDDVPALFSRLSSPQLPSRLSTNHFEQNASLVLVGIRGAGKSTLAIIASAAMKRKVIDAETAFQRSTGLSSVSYKNTNGSAECHRQQAKVLDAILCRNPINAIIVCSWMEKKTQALLRNFAITNPVIHILRDGPSIQEHLRIPDIDKVNSLLSVSAAIFRACTNLEFFNVSESPTEPLSPASSTANRRTSTPYLTLKRAERHFLKFLSLIYPGGAIPFVESAFPLASVPTEERMFTYALSVSLRTILNEEVDIEDMETGADAIEVVIDTENIVTPSLDPTWLNDITKVVGILRRNIVIPIILHVQMPGGVTIGDNLRQNYLEVISHVLRLAPEVVTIDLRLDDTEISTIMLSRGRSKIMGHSSIMTDPPPWQSSFWLSSYHRACRLGCDIVRLIRAALTPEDNFSVMRLKSYVNELEDRAKPLIAYNSGLLGRHSACFNSILTGVNPESHSITQWEYASQPCLTASEASRSLYASFLFNPMKLYVFGANVGYSLSPAMHNTALAACGIPHHYQPYSTDSLSRIKDLIQDPFFAGASVGLPFKVEIITLTHSLSRHAKAIGAVNTLIPVRQLNSNGSIPEDGSLFRGVNRCGPVLALYGENTDWIGIRACIRRGLSPANAVRSSTTGLVIGAGGMARAAVYAMLQLGVKNILIYNRTQSNAHKMVEHFKALLSQNSLPLLSSDMDSQTRFHVIQSLADSLPSFYRLPTIIISCIPTHRIGDAPEPNFTVPEHWLESRTGGVVIELAYKTLNTPLLEQIRKESYRGWVTMDGLDLLPEQGFAQFELFTGRRAPRRLMRREVFKAYPGEEGNGTSEELQIRLKNIIEQEP